jgi:hypothetical protein
MLEGSALAKEHETISGLLDRPFAQLQCMTVIPYVHGEIYDPFVNVPHFHVFLNGLEGDAARTSMVLALIERNFAYDARLSRRDNDLHLSMFFNYGTSAELMAGLIGRGVDLERIGPAIVRWFTLYSFVFYGTRPVRYVLDWLLKKYATDPLPGLWQPMLVALRGQCDDLGDAAGYGSGLRQRVDQLIGDGFWRVIPPCEHWSKAATEYLEGLTEAHRHLWLKLLKHCGTATSARPSAKWLKTAESMIGAIGSGEVATVVSQWLNLVDRGRTTRPLGMSWDGRDWQLSVHQVNATVLRGLLWMLPLTGHVDAPRIAGRVALSAYRKARGIGPRAPKVGNAAVFALSCIGDLSAVGQLAVLKTRLSFGTAQKEIEKAFNSAAAKLGLTREEIDEMGIPTYGFDGDGVREEQFGRASCTLRVVGGEVELEWRNDKGKAIKSPPSEAKSKEHADLLKEVKAAAKDAAQMLSAQRHRLDQLVGGSDGAREWAWGAFSERYLRHGLVGPLTRRLIWVLDGVPVTFDVFRAVDVEGGEVPFSDSSRVTAWHPAGRPVAEVLAWRARLEALGVTQPFKQAHREVYLLTEAELRTRVYSNRFAAHVIRQHQFNALAGARGWKNQLRLMVDSEFPPATKEMPAWGLRAEWWVEGIGDLYGTDTNESGTFLRLATDQVRFYRFDSVRRTSNPAIGGFRVVPDQDADPIPLAEVPVRVFSEVMRDVDLFVGVGSVGNDPNWADGGPQGRYRDYWHSYSFGELNASAATRREVLTRLLPRLTKLAGKWQLSDRFLVIRGNIRTYKIHLGSTNILMEPNDQYLCIVPDSRREPAPGYLPFEGDTQLSVILSKALLLVDDDKIADITITRQIALK